MDPATQPVDGTTTPARKRSKAAAEPPAAGAPGGPAADGAEPAIDGEVEPDAAELVEEEDEEEIVVSDDDSAGPSTDLVRAYLKEIGRVALLNA